METQQMQDEQDEEKGTEQTLERKDRQEQRKGSQKQTPREERQEIRKRETEGEEDSIEEGEA